MLNYFARRLELKQAITLTHQYLLFKLKIDILELDTGSEM